MQTFKEFLEEARSHAEQNPKISAYEYLKQYKDDPSIFISFTSVNKIGIHPRSGFRTPNGIYVYPLKDAWHDYHFDTVKSVGEAVPFAGKRKYIQIIKLINKHGVLLDMQKDFSSTDYLHMVSKIMDLINDVKKSKKLDDSMVLAFRKIEQSSSEIALQKTPIGELWAVTREMSLDRIFNPLLGSGDNTFKWNNLLRMLGFEGMIDRHSGLIYSGEPTQGFFLSMKPIKVIDMVLNQDYHDSDIKGGNIKRGAIWEKGMWYGGLFADGTWLDGIWKKGTFEKSTWKKGTWLNGLWKSGTWFNGTWFNGTWESGTWKKGEWKKGTWHKGLWESGRFDDGTWKSGTWKSGLFVNSTWEDGIWHAGDFEYAVWKKGTWKSGYFSGTWENGIWEDGTFDMTYFGKWEKGTWKKGKVRIKKFGGENFSSTVDPNQVIKLAEPCRTGMELREKLDQLKK